MTNLEIGPQAKKLRMTSSFDVASLAATPFDVSLPEKGSPDEPAFVCCADWKHGVETEILAQLESSDAMDGSERVPPMAVVRCSRGGKTRSLYEIARMMRAEKPSRDPIAVLFVSFHDFSSLHPGEQRDPLQALCQRIAFIAGSPADMASNIEIEIPSKILGST